MKKIRVDLIYFLFLFFFFFLLIFLFYFSDIIVIRKPKVCQVLFEFIYSDSFNFAEFGNWEEENFLDIFIICEKLKISRLFSFAVLMFPLTFSTQKDFWNANQKFSYFNKNEWIINIINSSVLSENTNISSSTFQTDIHKLFNFPSLHYSDVTLQVYSEESQQSKTFHLHKVFIYFIIYYFIIFFFLFFFFFYHFFFYLFIFLLLFFLFFIFFINLFFQRFF